MLSSKQKTTLSEGWLKVTQKTDPFPSLFIPNLPSLSQDLINPEWEALPKPTKLVFKPSFSLDEVDENISRCFYF